MINLNKLELTEQNLFKFITEYDIFDYYIKNFEVHTVFNSPLRTDHNPSFVVFKSNEYNKLLFKDFGTGDSGGCITFIRKLLGLKYGQALQQIVNDFNIQDKFIDFVSKKVSITDFNISHIANNVSTKDIKVKTKSIIQILPRLYEKYDFEFWKLFGITSYTLKKFWVSPLKYYFINGQTFVPHKYCYAYIEIKDFNLTYKIYQPYRLDWKWINNHPKGVHQGYIQLPYKGNLLIITKSLKDVMSLYSTVNISSIAIQNENIIIKGSVMKEYLKRFKKVIGFFDNDETGKQLNKIYTKKYGIKCILSPFENCKDFSSIVQNKGIKTAEKTILELIK